MLGITPTLQDTATALSFREGSLRTAYSRFDSLNHAVGVAQISNLLYRRFPIGSRANLRARCIIRKSRRLEALRYSRLEICATPRVKGNVVPRRRKAPANLEPCQAQAFHGEAPSCAPRRLFPLRRSGRNRSAVAGLCATTTPARWQCRCSNKSR